MKFLGGAPRPPVAVFPQSLDHEPDVCCGADTRLRVAEPETLGMRPDEGDGPFNEFRWHRRCRQRSGIARIRVRAVHANNLPSSVPSGKRRMGTGWAGRRGLTTGCQDGQDGLEDGDGWRWWWLKGILWILCILSAGEEEDRMAGWTGWGGATSWKSDSRPWRNPVPRSP